MSNLLPRHTIDSLVQTHDQAQQLVKEALDKLEQVRLLLTSVQGDKLPILFSSHTDFQYLSPDTVKRAQADAEKGLRGQCWKHALGLVGIREIMGRGDAEKFDKQFESGTLPDFTAQNVLATLRGLSSESAELATTAIREAFDYLRPRWGDYKTNQKYKVGRRVILSGVSVSRGYVNHYREPDIRSIDKAFHVLDGKRPPVYPAGLVTAIRAASLAGEATAATEYFQCKWFKNGNMHVEFLRLDLLAELNRIGAGGRMEMPGEEAA